MFRSLIMNLNNVLKDYNLTIEQQFKQIVTNKQIESMSKEQLVNFCKELYVAFMYKENIVKAMVKESLN